MLGSAHYSVSSGLQPHRAAAPKKVEHNVNFWSSSETAGVIGWNTMSIACSKTAAAMSATSQPVHGAESFNDVDAVPERPLASCPSERTFVRPRTNRGS